LHVVTEVQSAEVLQVRSYVAVLVSSETYWALATKTSATRTTKPRSFISGSRKDKERFEREEELLGEMGQRSVFKVEKKTRKAG